MRQAPESSRGRLASPSPPRMPRGSGYDVEGGVATVLIKFTALYREVRPRASSGRCVF